MYGQKLNHPVKDRALITSIFAAGKGNFDKLALDVFHFQYQHNEVYNQYCRLLNISPDDVHDISAIPFLPISFFKSHRVVSTAFEPQAIFESSGTTQSVNSKHFVKDLSLYETSFNKTFELFYGSPKKICILGLLPSYLERSNSSLVVMVRRLIEQSEHPHSGFYLNDLEKLHTTLTDLENQKQPTLLAGVTFALLNFAEQFPFKLQYTTLMETGGMKGRREELTRQQVHKILSDAFGVQHIHSEYGMTELLSQAYSTADGIFKTAPWMRVLVREEDDPFKVYDKVDRTVSGAINIIDLANLYSCSFIATEDAGKLYADGSFEVLGRLDNADVRGCSLMAV